MELPQDLMDTLVSRSSLTCERRKVCRIGGIGYRLTGTNKGLKIVSLPARTRANKAGSAWSTKYKKRGLLAIFFAHEQQRHAGGQEDDGRRQFELFEAHKLAQPLPVQAVTNLVVILSEHDKSMSRNRTSYNCHDVAGGEPSIAR